MDQFLHPQLGPSAQHLLRAGYGVLLLAFLLQTVPVARWFFVSERWGGYAQSGPLTNLVQNPVVLWPLMTLWIACAAALVAGVQTVPAAFLNLLLARYFFIHMRWKGVLRGGGAPGFMTYWLGACVFFTELTFQLDPQEILRPAVLLAFKVDFAFIMISAGLYKVLAGYPRNHGMELGVVNPYWGYWWRVARDTPPGHVLFRWMNHMAYLTELTAAALMLVPATQWVGGLLIAVSFLWIACHIRLGLLCEMVMLCGCLFLDPRGPADAALAAVVPAAAPAPQVLTSIPDAVLQALRWPFWIYAALLPLAHAGLFYNFLARKPLRGVAQKILEAYTNLFGIIIWRVFTTDVINFFVRIRVCGATGASREYTNLRWPDPRSRFRYWHVCEFVTLASVFTTLKYYPSNPGLFRERLLRYARTIPRGPGETLLFEYVSLLKTAERFEFVPVAEFLVDPAAGTIDERRLSAVVDIRAPGPASPVHEGAVPGSYAPRAAAEAR